MSIVQLKFFSTIFLSINKNKNVTKAEKILFFSKKSNILAKIAIVIVKNTKDFVAENLQKKHKEEKIFYVKNNKDEIFQHKLAIYM